MLISVQANVRTAEASRNSLQKGLSMAFKSGAITGLLGCWFSFVSNFNLLYYFNHSTSIIENY